MKKAPLTAKLITFLFTVAVFAYFGVQTWRYFTRPDITAPVYAYRAEHTLTLSGMLVRDEAVVECGEPLVELTRAEGERVAKGKPLATVYRSEQSLAAAREVSVLRAELEQLKYAQSAARDAETALRLDGEIESDIIALRAALTSGNYAALEADASALKATVLRREFAYRGSADLSGRIAETEARLASASAASGGASSVIAAPFSGTYSAVADGWEDVLTPGLLNSLTPAQFDSLAPHAASSTVGKLVRGERWYYAAVVSEADAARIKTGESYQLALSGVDSPLPISVASVGSAQNGRCVLVLTSDRYLSAVTALRAQSAELILESYEGLRIPKNALRIGEDGASGVYCRIGLQSYFKPVELVYQGEDYCLVRPGEIHATRESDLVLYTLRAGDEVIITAGELFNGRVIG